MLRSLVLFADLDLAAGAGLRVSAWNPSRKGFASDSAGQSDHQSGSRLLGADLSVFPAFMVSDSRCWKVWQSEWKHCITAVMR